MLQVRIATSQMATVLIASHNDDNVLQYISRVKVHADGDHTVLAIYTSDEQSIRDFLSQLNIAFQEIDPESDQGWL